MKIPNNSIIQVNGWIMLKKIKSIQYKIRHGNVYGITDKPEGVYWFTKPRGKKPIIGHFEPDVDAWIESKIPCNNRITILQSGE